MTEVPHREHELLLRVRRGAISDAELEAAMGEASVELRREASARAATSIRPDRLLVLLLQDESFARREAAGDALVKIGERAFHPLANVARGTESHPAMICVQVIARMEATGVLPLLRELAEHADPLRSQAALEGLSKKKDRGAIPTFVKALRLDSWRAFTAAVALRELGDASCVPELEKLQTLPEVGELVSELVLHLREVHHG